MEIVNFSSFKREKQNFLIWIERHNKTMNKFYCGKYWNKKTSRKQQKKSQEWERNFWKIVDRELIKMHSDASNICKADSNRHKLKMNKNCLSTFEFIYKKKFNESTKIFLWSNEKKNSFKFYPRGCMWFVLVVACRELRDVETFIDQKNLAWSTFVYC